MAFQTKSDIPASRYWEANRYAQLATKADPVRTTAGNFN